MRAIADETRIFHLEENEPQVINCLQTETTLVITNGFQSSKKIKLKYEAGSSYFFKINAVMDNMALLVTAGISVLLFIAYIISSVKLLLIIANVPLLVIVYFFFINPKGCIELKNWKPATAAR